VVESVGLGDRLVRGRALVRSGAVGNFALGPGEVRAELAGARGERYAVAVRMAPIARADWDRLQEILSRRAVFAARLLSGEMPEAIGEAFAEAGLRLFPETPEDLEVECGCGEPQPGCAHVAAVLQMMAERFDQDPFQILLLRGRGSEELLEELRRRWAEGGADPAPPARPADDDGWIAEALPRYGRLQGDLERVRPRIHPPAIPEAVLLRLGLPPGAPPDSSAADALREAYRHLSQWALRLAARETPTDEE
jgi:uncharacterized Zn finger protein